MKVENLCSEKVEVYDACPFCLTEIIAEKASTASEEKESLETEKPDIERGMDSKKKTPSESPSKIQACTHHFGYLSQRSAKEKIPEECMMCENIVQCMLKNIT